MNTDDDRALTELVYRYAQAVDRLDLDALVALFLPDATISIHGGDPDAPPVRQPMSGHDQIRERVAALERYEVTFHHVGSHLFDIAGDTATGETYCVAHHVSTVDGERRDRVMFIRYHDRFVRADDGWRFEERRLALDLTTDQPVG